MSEQVRNIAKVIADLFNSVPIECYGYAGIFGLICFTTGAMAAVVLHHFITE